MDHNCTFGITTYRKSLALDVLLESMVKHGYNKYPLIISDDNCGLVDKHGQSSMQVARKYSSSFERGITLCWNEKTPQCGVARSKNRILREFQKSCREAENMDSVCLLDDDIMFMNPGLVERMFLAAEKSDIGHISGYWTDFDENRLKNYRAGLLDGNPWHKDFPVKAANEYVNWHNGVHGCCVWVKADLALKAGYFNKYQYIYGTEHSAYSARLNRLEGLPPTLFPMLKRSEKYFMGQCVPNDYEISHDKINGVQTDTYRKILTDTYLGLNLYAGEDNLPKKGEKIMHEGRKYHAQGSKI